LIPFLKSYLPKSLQLAIEDERFYSFPQEVDYFWGACFMFPRQLLLKLKGLDERFFLYAEEEDFCYRAKKQGWKVVYFPQAKVVHIGQGSSVNYVEQAYKQLFYSEYLFFKKHYGRLYALSFRFAVMGLMFFRIILYKLLALINRKSAGIYGRIEYGCRLIFKAYQPGEKSFFDTFSSS
jgi:GT2 family glycosyltransferase